MTLDVLFCEDREQQLWYSPFRRRSISCGLFDISKLITHLVYYVEGRRRQEFFGKTKDGSLASEITRDRLCLIRHLWNKAMHTFVGILNDIGSQKQRNVKFLEKVRDGSVYLLPLDLLQN